ncbi:MAG TPA: hypothetical protein VGJ81_13835 [Thermoanaerobaculia bacterium]|jgi:tetratricopeptide (TPR) repeat protein
MKREVASAVLLSMIGVSAAWAGEGFGLSKKSVVLNRSLPAQVRLAGTRIDVRVSAQKKSNSGIADRMKSEVEAELLGNDTSLSLDAKNPTTIIEITVLRSDYSDSTENRKEARGQQKSNAGNNPLKVAVGQSDVNYKVVRHSFSATLKARDVRGNKTLLADTITKNYKESFENGNGAPDASSLEDDNMTEVAAEITRRLTPTKEAITVLLPKGRLEDAAPYAEAGMWNKYLDAMLALPKAANPIEESYHQYAQGVAYEALAYSAEEFDAALKYLEKAAALYNDAAEANPKEVNFILSSKPSSLFDRAQSTAGHLIPVLSQKREKKQAAILQAPLGRVQAALVQYESLKEFKGGSSSSGASHTTNKDKDTLTNDAIVDMLHGGVPEDVIITTIDTAPRRALDVSPRGLIQLSEAKASASLLRHVQEVAAKRDHGSAKKK